MQTKTQQGIKIMASYVIRHCESDLFVETASVDVITHTGDISDAMQLDEESAIAIANMAEQITEEDYEVMEIDC